MLDTIEDTKNFLEIFNKMLTEYGSDVYSLDVLIGDLTILSERILREFDKYSKGKGIYYETIDDYTKAVQSENSSLKTEISNLTLKLKQSETESGIVIDNSSKGAIEKIKELFDKLDQSEKKRSALKIKNVVTEDKLRLITGEFRKLKIQHEQMKDAVVESVPVAELQKYEVKVDELTKSLNESEQHYSILISEYQDKLKLLTDENRVFKQNLVRIKESAVQLTFKEPFLEQLLEEGIDFKPKYVPESDELDDGIKDIKLEYELFEGSFRQINDENNLLKSELSKIKEDYINQTIIEPAEDKTEQINELTQKLEVSKYETAALKIEFDQFKQQLLQVPETIIPAEQSQESTDQINELRLRLEESTLENSILKTEFDQLKQQLLQVPETIVPAEQSQESTDQINELRLRLEESTLKNSNLKIEYDQLKQQMSQIPVNIIPVELKHDRGDNLTGNVEDRNDLLDKYDKIYGDFKQLFNENNLLKQELAKIKGVSISYISEKLKQNISDQVSELNYKIRESIQKRGVLEIEVKKILSLYQKLDENRKSLTQLTEKIHRLRQELTLNHKIQHHLSTKKDSNSLIDEFNKELELSFQRRASLEVEVNNIIYIYQKLIENRDVINKLKEENSSLKHRLSKNNKHESAADHILTDRFDQVKDLTLKFEESEQKRFTLEGELNNIISIYQKLSENEKILANLQSDYSLQSQALTKSREIQSDLINDSNFNSKDQIIKLINKLDESEQKRFVLEGEVRNIISIYQKLLENKHILAELTEENTALKQELS
ncbi:MAG: hypothetical protein HQK91_01745 [Nitrospirae bacterium]|nr:hypothetical protein [Nitrospirota bacterium]